MKRWFLALIVLAIFFAAGLAFSDSVRISQVDNSMLLINQRVRLYISVTDDRGKPVKGLDLENFRAFESTEERGEKERRIRSVHHGVNINDGINLLFVIDNSGSMYWDGSGRVRNSDDESVWRITYAKHAISSILREIKNPLDRVGFVSFNVKIGQNVAPSGDKLETERALSGIIRPTEEEAYTELFETLYRSIESLQTVRGRKVVILLSDGVDFPLDENPHFPIRYGMEGAIELAQKAGISVFTIGLSKGADRGSLTGIAKRTGGAYFSVFEPERLEDLYNLIRDQVLNEYLVSYPATMDPATRKRVRIEYSNDGHSVSAEGVYFSSTIFGFPWVKVRPVYFVFIPGALLLLFLLSLFKFEKKETYASLSVLSVSGKRKGRQTLSFGDTHRPVTISVSKDADITVSGVRGRTPEGEVVIEEKDGAFTIVSRGGPVTVNNREVKKKVLRAGDLIRVEDTEIVFDGGKAGPSGRGKKAR